MYKSQKLVEIFIVFSCCIVLALMLNFALRSGSVIWMLPLIGVVGIAFTFKFWMIFSALIFATCWFSGSSPFLQTIPYFYFLIVAVLGASVINQAMKHSPKVCVKKVSLLSLSSIFTIILIVGIYTVITYLKYTGKLNYGVPGGLKFALQYLLVMAFIIWNFMGKVPNNFFDKIPAVALGLATFKMFIDLLNFIIPQSVYITYYFNTDLNFEVRSVLMEGAASALRVTGFREFGLYGLMFIMGRYCQKNRGKAGGQIGVSFLLLMGIFALMVLMSGFRGYLIRFICCILIFFWIYDRRWLTTFFVGAGAVWGGLIALGDVITIFPLPIQRVLGALPGVYKTFVAYNAYAGIEWRAELRRRFFATEFWHHPWFGRGQTGDLWEELINITSSTDMQFFEVSQMWHSGWVSTLDVVGVVGCFFLILLQLFTLFACWRLLTVYKPKLEGWMLWAVLFFITNIAVYWYTGFFQKNFPVIALSAMLVCLAYDQVSLDANKKVKPAV